MDSAHVFGELAPGAETLASFEGYVCAGQTVLMGTGKILFPAFIICRGLDSAFKMDLNPVIDPEMLNKVVTTNKAFDTGKFLTMRTREPGTGLKSLNMSAQNINP
jgi:hypothetical protein